MKKLIVRVAINCPFCFNQDVLDEVSTQTTTNSSFLTKAKSDDEIFIDFSGFNDLFNLNIKKYSDVWEHAITNRYSTGKDDYAREQYARKSITEMNNHLFGYINESNRINKIFNNIKNSSDNIEKRENASQFKYVFIAKRKFMIGNYVCIVKRGQSISDHLSDQDLQNYNYRENIRNVYRTLDSDCLLFSTEPKRKRNAKHTLYLKQVSDITCVLPIFSDIRVTLAYE